MSFIKVSIKHQIRSKMKIILRIAFTSALFILLQNISTAQLTVNGEIRPRAEYRNGFKTLTTESADPAFFVEQRTRIYLGYNTGSIKFQVNIQDVRVWGGASQIYKADPALNNLHEAWTEFAMSKDWKVKLGRQEIDYDGARFLGNLGWAQQSRSHDAMLVKYENGEKGVKLHFGGAYNQNVFEPTKLTGNFYSVNNYKTMQYAWYNKSITDGSLSVLVHNDGQQAADSTVAYRQTYGTRFLKKVGNINLDAELYYQGGKDQSKKEVSAFLLAFNAGTKLGKTNLNVGADYLSGTEATETKNTAFEPLYGTNHKFYGHMDYFYVGNAHRQNGKTIGLVDVFAKVAIPAGEHGKLDVQLHGFSSPVTIKDASNKEMSSYLGTEVDLIYSRNFFNGVANMQVGYSQMFGTDTMQRIKGGDKSAVNNWIWAMVTVKPALFSSKE